MTTKLIRHSIKGFTLVELMIAITIVAILAVVGFAVFQNVQRDARNAARRSDIQAIADALESRYVANTGTYPSLLGNMFASGQIPEDPRNQVAANVAYQYCFVYMNAASTPGAVPTTNYPNCANTSQVNRSSTGLPAATTTNWIVCANLEGSTAPYCLQNRRT